MKNIKILLNFKIIKKLVPQIFFLATLLSVTRKKGAMALFVPPLRGYATDCLFAIYDPLNMPIDSPRNMPLDSP